MFRSLWHDLYNVNFKQKCNVNTKVSEIANITFITHKLCPSCTTPVVTQTSHVVTMNTVSTISYTGLTTVDTKPSYDTFYAHAHTKQEQIKKNVLHYIKWNIEYVVKHIKFFSMWLNIFKTTKKHNLRTIWHVSV